MQASFPANPVAGNLPQVSIGGPASGRINRDVGRGHHAQADHLPVYPSPDRLDLVRQLLQVAPDRKLQHLAGRFLDLWIDVPAHLLPSS